MFLDKSYSEFYSEFRNALAERLKKENIDEIIIQSILDSGFYLYNNHVQDGYYDNKGAVPFTYFLKVLKDEVDVPFSNKNVPTYTINSLEDAQEILRLPFYERVINDICFRGQISHVSAKRPFPHPFFSDKDGRETLLLPGYWRQFLDNDKHISNERPMKPKTSFLELIGDKLLYYGINVLKLTERNFEKYGPHYLEDLEDFPDEESQEYYRRYKLKFTMSKGFEHSLIEQHYGFPTTGLDVTFDLKTALFFATNKFIKNTDGKASYTRINSNHKGVIYLLRFSSPKLTKTRDQVVTTSIFQHIPPIRPIKQSCALPFFHSTMVNEAAVHVVGILKIGENFSDSDFYDSSFLFPNKEEDKFYKALLELKEIFPEDLNDILEYDFDS